MFRRTRLLLLVLLAVIVGAVGIAYHRQRASLASRAPVKPSLLPVNTNAAAASWYWSKTEGDRTVVEVRADNFRQVDRQVELEGVNLKLYGRDGKTFDLVRSASASFHQEHGTLYSEGEVEITMRVPAEGAPKGRLVSIRTSGTTFESATGIARTDRPASFTFENGDGKCVGAVYDPSIRELVMKSEVALDWRGRGPKSAPMKIEAGELSYKERDSVVDLRGWSRLTRGGTVLDAGDSRVTLKDGAVDHVEAAAARGVDRSEGRDLEYSADKLWMEFTPEGELLKVLGWPNARLVTKAGSGRTSVSTDKFELQFTPGKDESTLTRAIATGHSVVESVPAPVKGRPAPESRKLTAEMVWLTMRPGGREVERMDTGAPGRLEFLPNSPGQRKRTLDGDRMVLYFRRENVLEKFAATKVATRTEPIRKDAAPLLTWSDSFEALFNERGDLARIDQWDNFRYEEGARRGRAERATFDQAGARTTLDRKARFQDATGTVSADRIELAQIKGDVVAEGNVVSTHAPDRKGKSSAMLSNDAPLEARAKRMTTSDDNSKIRYEGGAVLWQGASRIAAETVDVNRAERTLAASGHVRTQFADEQVKSKTAKAPAFVVVESAALTYREADRVAHYTGGAHLTRPGMQVDASEIRAFLNAADAESSLDRAQADGNVRILRTQPDRRTLRLTSEHADYFAAEQKLVLTGGEPTLEDSREGITRGRELTYYAKDDKLLVNGTEKAPAVSRIRRTPK